MVLDFFILPMIVCRHLAVSFADYARAALAPLIPGAAVASIVAVVLVVVFPHARGVTAVVEAVVVVAASWITMGVLLYRIEPELRDGIRRLLARRCTRRLS
jgi:phage gp46-like protein